MADRVALVRDAPDHTMVSELLIEDAELLLRQFALAIAGARRVRAAGAAVPDPGRFPRVDASGRALDVLDGGHAA